MLFDSHFHMINDSSMDILGLKIQFKDPNLAPIACTITRERGSLTLESPIEEICLGNFSPDEACDITFRFTDDSHILSEEALLKCFILEEIPDVPPLTFSLEEVLVLIKI